MPSTNPITLKLTVTGIDAYCRELSRRAPTLEKRVAAIDAIVTFVSTQTDVGEQARPEFAAIKQTLLDHFERARAELLSERAVKLRKALQAQQLPQVAALYTALSRDAFWTLLGKVEQELDAATLAAVRAWASDWMKEAKQRAQKASPYPDAVDFRAAGIEPSEYLAMTDLSRYLGVKA